MGWEKTQSGESFAQQSLNALRTRRTIKPTCQSANDDSASNFAGKLEKPALHFPLSLTSLTDVSNSFVCNIQIFSLTSCSAPHSSLQGCFTRIIYRRYCQFLERFSKAFVVMSSGFSYYHSSCWILSRRTIPFGVIYINSEFSSNIPNLNQSISTVARQSGQPHPFTLPKVSLFRIWTPNIQPFPPVQNTPKQSQWESLLTVFYRHFYSTAHHYLRYFKQTGYLSLCQCHMLHIFDALVVYQCNGSQRQFLLHLLVLPPGKLNPVDQLFISKR